MLCDVHLGVLMGLELCSCGGLVYFQNPNSKLNFRFQLYHKCISQEFSYLSVVLINKEGLKTKHVTLFFGFETLGLCYVFVWCEDERK